jgi:hypothetical protein
VVNLGTSSNLKIGIMDQTPEGDSCMNRSKWDINKVEATAAKFVHLFQGTLWESYSHLIGFVVRFV